MARARGGAPVSATKIQITLTAYNMGDAAESDFDAWAVWVANHVDEACNVDADVDQFTFGRGPDSDRVSGAADETIESVRAWLSTEGWEQFCAEGPAR